MNVKLYIRIMTYLGIITGSYIHSKGSDFWLEPVLMASCFLLSETMFYIQNDKYIKYAELDLKQRELCASNCASFETEIEENYDKLDKLTCQIMGKKWEQNKTFNS